MRTPQRTRFKFPPILPLILYFVANFGYGLFNLFDGGFICVKIQSYSTGVKRYLHTVFVNTLQPFYRALNFFCMQEGGQVKASS